MRGICAKVVPMNLTNKQKANCFSIRQLLDRLRTEPNFMHGVITSGESWVFEYGPEIKRQSGVACTCITAAVESSHEKIPNQVHAIVFDFSSEQTFYGEVLERSRKRILRIRPNSANS
ncbi:hypothetical protein Trydic_g21412 [Trypoxylus dichotomus]